MKRVFKLSWLFPLFAAALYAQTDAERCAALKRLSIPDVEITSAALAPAGPVGRGGPMPEHCVVRGAIDKRIGFGGKPFAIGFEMRLPVKWERRFLFQGGGGMDGTVRPALGSASGANTNPALARGFAVVSLDAGLGEPGCARSARSGACLCHGVERVQALR